jgi:hypothetical protein
VQFHDYQIQRDHSPGDEHGQGKEYRPYFSTEQILSSQRIGTEGGHKDINQRPQGCIGQCIEIRPPYFFIVQYYLIRIDIESLGKKADFPHIDIPCTAEGDDKDIPHGIEGKKPNDNHKDTVGTIEQADFDFFSSSYSVHILSPTTNWFRSTFLKPCLQ